MGKKKNRKLKRTPEFFLKNFRQKIFKPKIKLFIAMPTYKGIHPFTQRCLEKTFHYFEERGIPVLRGGDIGISHIYKARNDVVDYFMKKTDYTHLMFIDDDMAWNADDIEKMLLYDEDVVSAIVTRRAPPFTPTLYVIGKDEKSRVNTFKAKFGTYPLDKPFYMENSGIGTAFMLIKRHVFEKVGEPYFLTPITTAYTVRGEDYFFCLKMGKEGFRILYDPTIRVYHIGNCLFGLEDYIAFKTMEDKDDKICQYTNFDAVRVEEYKRSFAGVDESLIELCASAVAQRLSNSRPQAELNSESGSCQLPKNSDQTSQPTKTFTDACS